MRRRTLLSAAATAPLAASLSRPALAQNTGNLRFVPQADLSSIDPLWSVAVVSITHGYMVYDTLFGLDRSLTPRPQMCERADVSADNRTWTFTLRPGLLFHDGSPVRPADCIASVQRYMLKDPFMQTLGGLVTDWHVADDRSWTMQLSRPFPQAVFALAFRNVFIMPERVARTPPATQFTEVIGSGPFRFLRGEWQAGAHAGYARFDRYQPRPEAPDMFSGGKVARFDHVDWLVQPDPATPVAALQRGEVDLIERPLLDLLPVINAAPALATAELDTFGALAILRFNQLQPPFDNPRLRQALLPGIDQAEVVAAAVGDAKQYGTFPVGFFTAGPPMATLDGLGALTGPRDMDRARQLVAASGYKNERVVIPTPSDLAQINAMSLVVADQLKRMGLNVDVQTTDWGTMLSRVTRKDPVEAGGWSCFCVTWSGLSVATPGSSYPLRGNGAAGWNGWPTDPRLEELRQSWFDAPDPGAAKAICRDMQAEALQSLPYVPLGQWTQPAAFTRRLTGLLQSPFMLFWNARLT